MTTMREFEGYRVSVTGIFSPMIHGEPFHGITGYEVSEPPSWVLHDLSYERMCDEIVKASPELLASGITGKELDQQIMTATRGETWPYYEPFYRAIETLYGFIRVTYDPTPPDNQWDVSPRVQEIWLHKVSSDSEIGDTGE